MPSLVNPSAVPAMVEAVRARWERTTPRERLLLAGLALAGAAALPLAAQDWASTQAAHAAEDAGRLQILRSRNDGTRLRGAEARLALLEDKVRGWTPVAPSFAVARVQVEQDAALAAAQAGMSSLDVRAAETPDRIGGVAFVRAEVSGVLPPARLGELVRRLAEARPGLLVDRAATEPESRLRLVLLAPYRGAAGP